MPSTFRASRSGRHLDNGPNRTRTGQIDHDVFEGLPVRRWSRQPHTFSQAPKPDDLEFGVQGPSGVTTLPELPMPRDSQLLPAMSRALLRAARAGCVYIRDSGRAPNDNEKELPDAEDQAAAAVHLADRSFTSRKWMALPKHMEPPEIEFLAKRRPGLHSLYGGAAAADGSSGAPPMRKTKFKKVDPETGNISIYEAWVPDGHRIEGEITEDVQTLAEQSSVPVKSEAPAPGTVVDGVGVVNSEGVVVAEAGSAAVMTPPKRRPPPPKRKGKGIGKGRKKKVMFAPGEGADAATVHGVAPGPTDGATGFKQEEQDASRMSVDQSGQEEEDEDGEEGEESDEGDESMVDAKTPETPQPQSGAESTDRPSTDVDMTDATSEALPDSQEPSRPEQEAPSQEPAEPEISQPEELSQEDPGAQASTTSTTPAEKTEEPTTESAETPHEKPAVSAVDESAAGEELPPATTEDEPNIEHSEQAVPDDETQASEQAAPPLAEEAADPSVGSKSAEVTEPASKEIKGESPSTDRDEPAAAPTANPEESSIEEDFSKQSQAPGPSAGGSIEATEQGSNPSPTPSGAQESEQAPEQPVPQLDVPQKPAPENKSQEPAAPEPTEKKEDIEMGVAPGPLELQPPQEKDSASAQAEPPAEPQPTPGEPVESSAPDSSATGPTEPGQAEGTGRGAEEQT
ncbi:hypothetical protein NUU61_000465 [Penicillium alfredii]|uniref:LYR family protein n=1 Tax=Penicillium alfredii TaxID=1506179 RepID=A0A9W9KR16_9EURO|nr:uncharacterized protein NUU61_000465 [Penicillium alfredii]KAJ5114706.1 hypothetical protein NUU61_000465 [Penicillium alfredii]